MNLTRSSRPVALALVLVVALGLGTAAVATADIFGETEDGPPAEAEVGAELRFTVVVDAPFDVDDPWTLQATSALDEATVTLVSLDGAGNQVERTTNRTLELDSSDGVSSVEIQVTGDVPAIQTYSYEDPAREHVQALRVAEVVDGEASTVENGSFDVHRYTEESREARQAIDDASEAVADADSSDAEDRLEEAIVHYDSENFAEAISAADDARDTAESEGELRELLLLGAGVVVIFALVGGGIYLWQARQEDTNKLQ